MPSSTPPSSSGGDPRPKWLLAGLAAVVIASALAYALWPRNESPAPAPVAQTDDLNPSEAAFVPANLAKVDVHVHFGLRQSDQALGIMDAHNVQIALNASGGTPGGGLEESVAIQQASHGRIRPYCNVGFRQLEAEGYEEYVTTALRACKEMGAVGVKIFKGLGLGVTQADGALVPADDPRLDFLFELAGNLDLPVLMHSGDPVAFFEPADGNNERLEELTAHPSWSFYGERPEAPGTPWPSWEAIFSQFERRVARHQNTTIVGAHFGNAPEYPERVGRLLERNPRFVVETGARIPEIGRHPASEMRALFERYQDRILFGTDLAVTGRGLTLGSGGLEPDPPERVAPFFLSHFRYFETNDTSFAHPTPIQGAWTIDGIGLSTEVLRKVYSENARRIFHLGTASE